MNNKQRIIVSITGIFIVLLALAGFTYAYFLTQVNGNEMNKSISITSANLELIYEDGNGLLTPAEAIKPGDAIKFFDANNNKVSNKTFTVTNKGNTRIDEYVVVLENVINNIYLRDDFIYTLSCVSVDNNTNETKGTCNGVSNIPFPRNDGILVTNGIDPDVKHKYTLTVKYKETNKNQSIDMGKTISAKINIYDRKEIKPLLIENDNVIQYINNLNQLDELSNTYLRNNGIDPSTTSSSTYNRGQGKWLTFNSISKLDYDSDSWTEVAGSKNTGFTKFLTEKNNIDINMFDDMTYIATDSGEESSVTHFAAALVARMYNTDAILNIVIAEEDFDNLAGWAGDLQTLIRYNLITKITDANNYEEVYNKMSTLIGKSNTYFDSDDLYSDIDAYNIYYLLNTTNSTKDIMTDYFTYKYNNRFNLFVKKIAGKLDYASLQDKIYPYTKYSSTWPLYRGMDTTKFTTTVSQAARDAFTDYIWYLANYKELNIFSHEINFSKGKSYDFIAEFININNKRDEELTNEDFTWTVTNINGTTSLSTISNGKLTIPNNETAKELKLTISLNKSNKIISNRIIKIS